RDIADELLRSWGMEPTLTAHVDDALRALADRKASGAPPFRLLVVDLAVGGPNGAEIPRRLGDPATRGGAPIVLLAASAEPLPRDELARLGVARVLPKPVKQSDLLDAV